MPEDPLAAIIGQLSVGLNEVGGNFGKMSQSVMSMMGDGMKGAEAMAPHAVLASLFKGTGYFTAKTPTSTLQTRNIF